MRPDFAGQQRQQRHIASHVGETATWLKYVSTVTGQPQYGIGDTQQFVQVLITALFAPLLPEEIQAAGGVYLMGDVRMTPMDAPVGPTDQVIWRGAAHHVMSDPLPQPIVAGVTRLLLRRGGQTG